MSQIQYSILGMGKWKSVGNVIFELRKVQNQYKFVYFGNMMPGENIDQAVCRQLLYDSL